MARWRYRQSRREQLLANNCADAYYAAMAGVEPKVQNIIPPKRDRVRRPVDGKPAAPLEREILADILQVLRADPRIGFVWRQTSGTFQDGERWIKAGPRG